MDALPDNAVRIAIQSVSGKAGLTLGPAVIGTSGSQYRVVLDYGNVDTANMRFVLRGDGDLLTRIGQKEPDLAGVSLQRVPDNAAVPFDAEVIVVPVYVGVGLRLTALVDVKKGSINLASLGAIAAAAEADQVAGTLTVQTLGVSGPQVSSTLPLPSELNSTTVQNAIQSLGAIKAIIYDKDTSVTPRVTGIYNPLPSSDPRLINAMVSQLAAEPIDWKPCMK